MILSDLQVLHKELCEAEEIGMRVYSILPIGLFKFEIINKFYDATHSDHRVTLRSKTLYFYSWRAKANTKYDIFIDPKLIYIK